MSTFGFLPNSSGRVLVPVVDFVPHLAGFGAAGVVAGTFAKPPGAAFVLGGLDGLALPFGQQIPRREVCATHTYRQNVVKPVSL